MFTFEQVREAVAAEIAIEAEDFVYEIPPESQVCVYVDNGQPSCLIGRAAFRLGVPVNELQEWDDSVDSGISWIGGHVYTDLFTPKALEFATMVQDKQDIHETWGDAYAAGIKTVCNLNEDGEHV